MYRINPTDLLDYIDKIGGLDNAPGFTGFDRQVEIKRGKVTCIDVVSERTPEEDSFRQWANGVVVKARAKAAMDLFVADEFCIKVLLVHPEVVFPGWHSLPEYPVDLQLVEDAIEAKEVTSFAALGRLLRSIVSAATPDMSSSGVHKRATSIAADLDPEVLALLPSPVMLADAA